MRRVVLAWLIMAGPLVGGATAQSAAIPSLTGDLLYRLTLLRAAPGRFQELLDQVGAVARSGTGPARGLVLRHSQGDHWDFMVLVPVGAPESGRWLEHIRASFSDVAVAWQEDELVRGPAFDVLPGFLDHTLYHVEMFDAAPGRSADVLKERAMENAYLSAVGRPPTLIFRREFGAAWDSFTIGAYRDWRHYAERDLIPPEKAKAAAVAAGFESDAAVGPYLRSLILTHHDTLATRVR